MSGGRAELPVRSGRGPSRERELAPWAQDILSWLGLVPGHSREILPATSSAAASPAAEPLHCGGRTSRERELAPWARDILSWLGLVRPTSPAPPPLVLRPEGSGTTLGLTTTDSAPAASHSEPIALSASQSHPQAINSFGPQAINSLGSHAINSLGSHAMKSLDPPAINTLEESVPSVPSSSASSMLGRGKGKGKGRGAWTPTQLQKFDRRRESRLRRRAPSLGQPCTSAYQKPHKLDDKPYEDCEDWCDDSKVNHCRYLAPPPSPLVCYQKPHKLDDKPYEACNDWCDDSKVKHSGCTPDYKTKKLLTLCGSTTANQI
jgi:hypothetical protein